MEIEAAINSCKSFFRLKLPFSGDKTILALIDRSDESSPVIWIKAKDAAITLGYTEVKKPIRDHVQAAFKREWREIKDVGPICSLWEKLTSRRYLSKKKVYIR